jgi:TRAP-type mannitol/chloroaromatic compound transport system permease small subunit
MVTAPQGAAPAHLAALRSFVAASGKAVAWLTVVMVLLTFIIVVLRYGFNLGWIWLQESLTYLHVAVFSIAAAWALQQDSHVRVDIFYAKMTKKNQARVNLLGSLLFLVPFCVFVLFIAWPYVANSWMLLESSREAGGLPLVFLLKSLIMLMPALLLCQAVINITDAWKTLRHENPV